MRGCFVGLCSGSLPAHRQKRIQLPVPNFYDSTAGHCLHQLRVTLSKVDKAVLSQAVCKGQEARAQEAFHFLEGQKLELSPESKRV